MIKLLFKFCIVIVVFLSCNLSISMKAAESNQEQVSFDETVATLLSTMQEYLETRLVSLDTSTKNNLLKYAGDELSDQTYINDVQKNPMFMRMMGLYGSLGRAYTLGHKEGYPDIIRDYYNLSDNAKERVVSELKLAFEGINLKTSFNNNIIRITTSNGLSIGEIVFDTNDTSTDTEGSEGIGIFNELGNDNIVIENVVVYQDDTVPIEESAITDIAEAENIETNGRAFVDSAEDEVSDYRLDENIHINQEVELNNIQINDLNEDARIKNQSTYMTVATLSILILVMGYVFIRGKK